MDYIYFAFGSLGAVLAVNRMNAVGEKLILSDLHVPVILASALVIRVIKTRASLKRLMLPESPPQSRLRKATVKLLDGISCV
jgi:hypothetical protein